MEGEGTGTMCRAVGKQDLEAALAEDGTECHSENKKGLCVMAGGGRELESSWPWSLGAPGILRLPQPDPSLLWGPGVAKKQHLTLHDLSTSYLIVLLNFI